MTKEKTKILIAEDELFQLNYIVEDIKSKRGDVYEITGTARTGLELLKLWKKTSPGLILVDINLPVISGYKVIKEIRKTDTTVSIIVLTCLAEVGIIEGLVGDIESYLIKDRETPAGLIRTIDEIVRFRKSSFRKYILEILKSKEDAPTLSHIDFEICCNIKEGLTNAEISNLMHLSKRSIEGRIYRLYKYFGVKGRVELVVKLNQLGLI